MGSVLLLGLLTCSTSLAELKVVKPPSPADPTSETAPHLVIEAGGHRAIIRELLFTADGGELVSVGDDKTVRVWTVAPDGRRATLARTLRGEMGDGRQGQIAAVALSPPDRTGQQRWLAVGGFLAGPPEDRHAVRLHDYASGEVQAPLYGHTDLVLALAFSPSGRWLASAGKDNTIRLWDLDALQGHQLLKAPLVLEGHSGHVYDLAWSPRGDRLASASYDRTVGLWETEHLLQGQVKRLARLKGHTRQVTTVVFHPSGEVLASGGKDQRIRLWRARDGKSQGVFAKTPNQVAALAFSPDGQRLLAGRIGGSDEPKQVTLFAYPSGRVQNVFTEHDNIVLATAFHPSGRWVASGGGDRKEILLWDVDTGKVLSRLAGGGRTIWAVGFAKDGGSIGWGQTFTHPSELDRRPLDHWFDLDQLQLRQGGLPPSDAVRAQDRVGEVSLEAQRGGPYGYAFRLQVYRGSKGLGVIERGAQNGYRHSAYTLTPDGQYVLSGGLNGTLTLYTLTGDMRARLIGHSGEIKAVAVSADGRWALSGASDQTIKLWSLAARSSAGVSDILPTLSLFPSADGEWVAWRPEGIFAASRHGANLIGYSLNQGRDRLARYVSIDQLYDRFYRPDLIYQRLHGPAASPGLQKGEGQSPDITAALATGSPPRVTFVSPAVSMTVTQPDMTVSVEITDQGGGIGKVEWKINGITVDVDTEAERESRLGKAGILAKTIKLTQRLTLSAGINTIALTAYNQANEIASLPKLLVVTLEAPGLASASDKPNLYLITVGVNRYRDRSLWLSYALPDAQALSSTLCRVAAPLFGSITIEKVYDEDAVLSRMQVTFEKVAARAKPRDVFVLYMAGHGVTRDGRYYFLPYDFRYHGDASVRQTAINQDHLQNWLASIPARKSLVLIDTCESGSFPQALAARGMAEKTAVAKLTRATGRATIVAATAEQIALEGIQGHGAFTYVLMQALRQADAHFGNGDGLTSFFELAQYVDDQVPKITLREFGYEQIPQVNMVGSDFPIGVLRVGERMANVQCDRP